MLHRNSRGRPSAEDIKIRCTQDVIEKTKQLREEMSFDKDKKLVLLLSFSTDEMIREVQKNPEVWFMDVTGRANKQKRDLFVMVVRKPDTKCAIGNVTLIPSCK
jgi:hypothetical protein